VVHEVFPAQLSFNLMAGTLRDTEQRVERHLATLLNAATPIRLPALRVVQSPVMHCYSASLWVEFANPVEKLAGSLREEGFDIWPDDAPSVLGVAGQNGISIGAIEPDRNRRGAYWLWAVADNYRLSADNAVMLAQATLP
jgi:aspartate-semialdehyde dehydrogenase